MYEKKDYDKEVELLHCGYPREDVQKGKKAATMLPVASVYLDEIYHNFFEMRCVNISKYLRKKIEEDTDYKKWKEEYGLYG